MSSEDVLGNVSPADKNEGIKIQADLLKHLEYFLDLYEFHKNVEKLNLQDIWRKWLEDRIGDVELESKIQALGLKKEVEYGKIKEFFKRAKPTTFDWHAVRVSNDFKDIVKLLDEFKTESRKMIKDMNIEMFEKTWSKKIAELATIDVSEEKLQKIIMPNLLLDEFTSIKNSVLEGEIEIVYEGAEMFKSISSTYENSLKKIGVIKSKDYGTPEPLELLPASLVGLGSGILIGYDYLISEDFRSIGAGLVGIGNALALLP